MFGQECGLSAMLGAKTKWFLLVFLLPTQSVGVYVFDFVLKYPGPFGRASHGFHGG